MGNPPLEPPQDPFSLHPNPEAKQRCDLDPIFKAGAEARRLGRSQHDNPYALGSQERDEWDAGYVATPDLERDDESNAPL